MRFLADVNFRNQIVRGLTRRDPTVDIVRAQDVGLDAAPDDELLEWAATESRVVLTHDRKTMPHFANTRVANAQAMAGVIVVSDEKQTGPAIDDLFVIATCSDQSYWQDRVDYLS